MSLFFIFVISVYILFMTLFEFFLIIFFFFFIISKNSSLFVYKKFIISFYKSYRYRNYLILKILLSISRIYEGFL